MVMYCSGTFHSIMGRKLAKYVIWELIYELCICYELYKENIRFYELTSIYWVQWLMWSVKVPLLGLIMKYGMWGVYWIKNNKNLVIQVQVMVYWTLTYFFWPFIFIIHIQSISNVYTTPTQWIHCHLKWTYASMTLQLGY